jgi:quinol-cytochrome oxidoreductase complex cytochrome b subunit
MLNKILMWVVIILLVVSQGFTAYKLSKLQDSIIGLTFIVTTTNQDASRLLGKLLPLATLKDQSVRDRLIKNEFVQYKGGNIGTRTQAN